MSITDLFGLIASGATSLAQAFGNLFSGITPIFWTAGDGTTAGSPTMITIFLIGGVVLTLGFWAIDKIFGLAKLGLSGISKARAKRSKKA